MELKVVARIHTDFPDKFGIPRQSCLVGGLRGTVVFEKEFQDPNFVRGLDEYSDIWLIWGFSESEPGACSPTVRPPRLGGNVRKGVFASRSPFRPNPLALSRVRLDEVELAEHGGPVLHVSGVDMVDGSPIYDIKPFSWADRNASAQVGFSAPGYPSLDVADPEGVLSGLEVAEADVILALIGQDPRPAYQDDPGRVYAMRYAKWTIRFRVEGRQALVVELVEE